MFVDLEAAAKAVVGELVAAGVRAVVDARDINPPCVQVRPPRLNYRFGKGAELEWEAYAIVGEAGTGLPTYKALGDLVDAAQDALGGRITTAIPDTVTTGEGPSLPMYRLSWTDRVNHR